MSEVIRQIVTALQDYPSIANANVESQKLGPVEKKTCATMPSDLPFHSTGL